MFNEIQIFWKKALEDRKLLILKAASISAKIFHSMYVHIKVIDNSLKICCIPGNNSCRKA